MGEISFVIKAFRRVLCKLTLDQSFLISQLKSEVSRASPCDPARIRLVHQGILLDDRRPIHSYHFPSPATIYCSLIPPIRRRPECPGIRELDQLITDPEFSDLTEDFPLQAQLIQSRPDLAPLFRDTDLTRESWNLISGKAGEGRAAHLLDAALNLLDSGPRRSQLAVREITDVEDAMQDILLSQTSTSIPTNLGDPQDSPSEEPLIDGNFSSLFHIALSSEAEDKVSKLIVELREVGIELAEMAGMRALKKFVTPETERKPIGEEWRHRFAVQLKQMEAMGYTDFEENVRALVQAGGNVGHALDAIWDGRGD
jgi:hypothetical protein